MIGITPVKETSRMLSHPLIVVGFPLLTSIALGLVVRAAEKRASPRRNRLDGGHGIPLHASLERGNGACDNA